MAPFRMKVGLAVFLAWALLAPQVAFAEPPIPGSTAEYKAANKAYLLAVWSPSGLARLSAEQEEKNRVAKEQAWTEVRRLMPAACDKGDARACADIATGEPLFSKLPNSRAARQQAAARASAGYAHFCTVQPRACNEWKGFLEELEAVDQQFPSLATTVPSAAWIELGRAFDRTCRAAKGAIDLSEACENASAVYETRAPVQWRALHEFLCARNDSDSCHKLGRLSSEQAAEDREKSVKCEKGDANACTLLAYVITSRSTTSEAAEEGRHWAAKGCELDDVKSCMYLGGLALATQFGGTTDPTRALAAFSKACRMKPSADQKKACENEATVREWIASKAR